MEDLTGNKVYSEKNGEGVIVKLQGVKLTVRFGETEKIFCFPDCFEKFLVLYNKDLAAEIDALIKERNRAVEKKKQDNIKNSYAGPGEQIKRQGNELFVRQFTDTDRFFESCTEAVDQEIAFLKKNGGTRYRLSDGRCIEKNNISYIYYFETDEEFNYPVDTEIKIYYKGRELQGKIIYAGEFTLTFSVSVFLGVKIPVIEFTEASWFLLKSLNERLREISLNPSFIVKSLILHGREAIEYNKEGITKGQGSAIKMASEQPVTFIWGPPGTGKTQTLANIALKFISAGRRVLMVSYSNVSVDGAILRVDSLDEKKETGKIVRYGYPRDKNLLEKDYLTSYNIAINRKPELLTRREKIINQMKNAPYNSYTLKKELEKIREALKGEETDIVNRAQFVATTVSKAVVDKTVFKGSFDVVIFDEASMAYIPHVIFAASLAKSHFICLGDFNQLPPVVQSSKDSMLNADIFQYCGIETAVETNRNHKWLCMLDLQYRMHPSIASFASKHMYNNLLKSPDYMADKRQSVLMSSPFPGEALTVADLSGLMSVCTKTAGRSRINVLSAFISFLFAAAASGNNEVGIITPYHAQSKLINAMARDFTEGKSLLKPVVCATVHQFQGSEKDVIIYDAVDCYRMKYPGILNSSVKNNYADRLFNVALTRAGGKFIALTNIGYMYEKKLSEKLMFRQLLKMQYGTPACVRWEKIFSEAFCENFNSLIRRTAGGKFIIYRGSERADRFIEDIRKAKNEIRIDIPANPENNKSLQEIAFELKKAAERGIRVFIRAEAKMCLPECIRGMAAGNEFICNPVAVTDKKIIWYGMPDSDSNFYIGNGRIKTEYHPVMRFEGKRTAAVLFHMLEMDNTSDSCRQIAPGRDGKHEINTFPEYLIATQMSPLSKKPENYKIVMKRCFKFYGSDEYSGYKLIYVTEDMVKDYLTDNEKNNRCPICGSRFEVYDDSDGIYVRCCGPCRHKFYPEEI